MKITLYNLTQDEAIVLLNHINYDIGLLATILWDRGIANDFISGIAKSKRLINFSKSIKE